MTPRARSCSVRRRMRFSAPRSLKDPVTFRVSSLRYSAQPASRDKFSEYGHGVRRMLPQIRSRAARMSSSDSMNIHSSAAGGCFELYPLRFGFVAREPIHLPAGESANLLRGGFGKALRRGNPDAYARYFAPSASEGPSGLRDLPRPFVFRVAHLDGVRLA